MRLLEFFQGFIDLFRSRYVRYLEGEVIRLRQENAGLNTTLLSSRGITVVPSPDLQDLTARGAELRKPRAADRGTMRPVVRSKSRQDWRKALEMESAKEAAGFEEEIRQEREKQEAINAP